MLEARSNQLENVGTRSISSSRMFSFTSMCATPVLLTAAPRARGEEIKPDGQQSLAGTRSQLRHLMADESPWF